MSKLSHPNILPLVGFFLDDTTFQTAWIISPHISNGDVKDYLESNEVTREKRMALVCLPFPWCTQPSHLRTILSQALDVAQGLLYLHSQNPPICHADIKPVSNIIITLLFIWLLVDFILQRNVLVNDELRAMICDFGIARVMSETSGFTTSKNIKGSAAYMSPELFLEDNPKHTHKSDVWAWACLLLEASEADTQSR